MKYYQQILAGVFLVTGCIFFLIKGTDLILKDQRSVLYSGPHWKHQGQTLDATEVFNSKFVRIESHTVRTGKGDVVNGWIWIDYHDRVNVLVEDERGVFTVLRQTSYGLGSTSLSVVSGAVALNENPREAAARELLDELGMISHDWFFLGKFRTDANRGGGFVYSFLAKKAVLDKRGRKSPTNELEKREVIRMTARQLSVSVLRGEFGDAKWSNTVALALLRMQTPNSPALSLHDVDMPANQIAGVQV
jgi:hypothetical protein